MLRRPDAEYQLEVAYQAWVIASGAGGITETLARLRFEALAAALRGTIDDGCSATISD